VLLLRHLHGAVCIARVVSGADAPEKSCDDRLGEEVILDDQDLWKDRGIGGRELDGHSPDTAHHTISRVSTGGAVA
jgi:hypothetical protein